MLRLVRTWTRLGGKGWEKDGKRMGKGWEKDGKRVCFALFEHLSMCKGHRVNLCNAQSWVLRQIATKKAFQRRWDMQQSTRWRLLEGPWDPLLKTFTSRIWNLDSNALIYYNMWTGYV